MQLLEELKTHPRSRFVLGGFFGLLILAGLWFALELKPISPGAAPKTLFEIKAGEGFRGITDRLEEEGLIRSDLAAKAYFLFSGSAFHLQPGIYLLGGSLSVQEIARIISVGQEEVRVTIPEGYSIYEIDAALAENYVLKPGALISWAKVQSFPVEGRLFPDTYNFFLNSTTSDVAEKMLSNFDAKVTQILPKDQAQAKKIIIIASILEKEVPNYKDRQVVAGIILKRLAAKMAIQVDATVCYAKRMAGNSNCYPLTPSDFKADSPYNTYVYRGLPPGPIGNPGLSAIQAAMTPAQSDYWYYLSDPKTGKTIFSETLDSQASNRVKYLKK